MFLWLPQINRKWQANAEKRMQNNSSRGDYFAKKF